MPLHSLDDALDIMGNCSYREAEGIIMQETQFHKDFFDLKTKLAGNILQKFSNYRMRLAIVGDFEKYGSKSLRDFIRESNKQKQVLFVSNKTEAFKRLS